MQTETQKSDNKRRLAVERDVWFFLFWLIVNTDEESSKHNVTEFVQNC